MASLFRQAALRTQRGERLALCVVVAAKGSTPQGAGAKMLVSPSGELAGTLGGGCVEAEVRRRALQLLAANPQPVSPDTPGELFTFRLDSDLGWDDGLICGGSLDIFVRLLAPADAPEFLDLAAAIDDRRPASFRFTYTAGDQARQYLERLAPPPALVIAGAGHVGQALAALATPLGFDVTVIDDRPDFASPERFPTAARRITADVESHLAKIPLDDLTYIVIVTRGHRGDGRALAAILRRATATTPQYVGLIGSKRKIIAILSDLAAQAIPEHLLHRVHAPIGLDIGAQSVPEIALSIAAELTAIRHRLPVEHAADSPVGRPMKLTPDQIAAAIHRAASANPIPPSDR
ncbi:MAG TPA: XdhC family protein [Phycisphaerae bacterium]|nr:XdhC family protein [Phycisphaerae bacterium]